MHITYNKMILLWTQGINMATEADDIQLKQKVIAKADENMPTKADDTNMHQRQDQIYGDQAKKK